MKEHIELAADIGNYPNRKLNRSPEDLNMFTSIVVITSIATPLLKTVLKEPPELE